jgi:hypothetical protein
MQVGQTTASPAFGDCGRLIGALRIAFNALALATAVNTAACTRELFAPNGDVRPRLEGRWGGDHIVVDLTTSGGTVEYDCARGTIDGVIRPDNDGRFTAIGTHVVGTPGPERVGAPKRDEPAQYSGSVRDSTMVLTVVLLNSGQSLGSFVLARGQVGVLRKCLWRSAQPSG